MRRGRVEHACYLNAREENFFHKYHANTYKMSFYLYYYSPSRHYFLPPYFSLLLGANLLRQDKSVFVPLRHINLASRQILKMRSSPFHLLLATFVGLTNFYERLRNSTLLLFLLSKVPHKKLHRFIQHKCLPEIIVS